MNNATWTNWDSATELPEELKDFDSVVRAAGFALQALIATRPPNLELVVTMFIGVEHGEHRVGATLTNVPPDLLRELLLAQLDAVSRVKGRVADAPVTH